MQVILLTDVPSHGRKGAVVEVSEGYARNFLFPAHLAIEASPKALSEKKEKEDREKGKEKKAEKEDRALAAKIDGSEVVITAKSEGGKLFAAVGPKDVRAALKELGYKVDEDWIEMEPVKEPGTTSAIVNFPTGYEATVTVVVET